jgi:hypothetical protein
MKFSRSTVAVAAAMTTLIGFVGCAGSVPDATGKGGSGGSGGGGGTAVACVPTGPTTNDAGIPPTFATVKSAFLGGGAIAACATAPCHAEGGTEPPPPETALWLQDVPQLYSRMLAYTAVQCSNKKLVVPGHPEQSALIDIISGPCGAAPRMPYQCTDDACLPPEYIAALSQWISLCAPEQ